jgi:hypothetical protein
MKVEIEEPGFLDAGEIDAILENFMEPCGPGAGRSDNEKTR